MMGRKVLPFILLQVMVKIAVVFADEEAIFSRSTYFVTQENKQLKGYVYRQFNSPSSMSCSRSCLRNVWCTSTNFKEFPTKDGTGTCELNKHEMPLTNADNKIHDQQGITFSMLMKGCLMTGCLNGGLCLSDEQTGTYSCSCAPPWIGDRCDVLPPECQNYQKLASDDRKNTFRSNSSNYLCDVSLGPGWFRFQGAAGIKMPTSCVPGRRCGGRAPGWLNGTHPTVADGVVTRRVCFHWHRGNRVMNCCYRSITIKVRNCSSYSVYYFHGTPGSHCNLRYCGAD